MIRKYIPENSDIVDSHKLMLDPVVKAIVFEIIDNFSYLKKGNPIETGDNPISNGKNENIEKVLDAFREKGWNIEFKRLGGGRADGDMYRIDSLVEEKTTVFEDKSFYLIPNQSEMEEMIDKGMLDTIKIVLFFNFMMYNHYLFGVYGNLKDGRYAETRVFRNIDEEQLKVFIDNYKDIFREKGWDIDLLDWKKLYNQNKDFKKRIDVLEEQSKIRPTQRLREINERLLEQRKATEYVVIKRDESSIEKGI